MTSDFEHFHEFIGHLLIFLEEIAIFFCFMGSGTLLSAHIFS